MKECFKNNWKEHKKVHKVSEKEATQYPPDIYPNFAYTGPLRPYPQSSRRLVPMNIARPDYAFHPNVIKILTDEEIEGLKVACKLAREVMDEAAACIAPGISTDEIDRVVHEACIERDCYPSPLGYYKFPKSCCTSVNEVICHGIPDTRPLVDGDIVNVDITVFHGGFHGDLNETFFVGNVDEAGKKLVRVTYESLMEAIKIGRCSQRAFFLNN
ncbi:unnamed protein product [Soboliphyme baturini]|uniref:Peptidase_M24 domain-containing protein n=1 Tax=Soboliphyme baturini TaxID=241478 RepID=A0A183J7F0_9BILA|nr:unnamed protein product [Soboliphyme baturini]